MKKLLIISLFILATCLLSAAAQMAFEVKSTEDDGMINRLSSYIHINSGDWTFVNTTKIKHSEYQNNIDNYYQESYVRNLLQSYLIKDNYTFNLQLGLGLSPSDNHKVLPQGVDLLLEQKNTYDIGGGFLYDNGKLYFDLNVEHYSADYDQYELDEISGEKITESDLIANAKAGYWLSSDLLIYAAANHFNDLNDISDYNYTESSLNLQYKKRLSYAQYLQQEIAIGNSDLDDNLQNFLRTNTRLSTRFAPDWTLLNILEYELWLDDENEMYIGNSWLNSIIRRNLKLSDENELSYFQTAVMYELDSEIGYGQLAIDYYISHIQLEISEKYFFGENRWLDQKLSAGIAWNIPVTSLRFGYTADMVSYADDEEDLNHKFTIDYRF